MRRHGAQIVQQQIGIMVDRRHAVAREQRREQPHHHLAVFQHVRHARWHAQIVFEYVELALARAHDVDAGNVGVDIQRHLDALHGRSVLRVIQDLFGRNDARLQDVLVVVHIVQEAVQRGHALHQAGLQLGPLGGVDHARNDVEWDQAFLAGVVAVHSERDPHALEVQLGFRPLLIDQMRGLLGEPIRERLVMRPHSCLIGIHFIVKVRHHCLLCQNTNKKRASHPVRLTSQTNAGMNHA